MPLTLSKLYHALLEASVDEQHATEAAEEAAQYATRFTSIEAHLARIESYLEGLKHRLHLFMTAIFIVFGGVLSTLWFLARR